MTSENISMWMYYCFEGKGGQNNFHLSIFFEIISFFSTDLYTAKISFLDYKIVFLNCIKSLYSFLCLIRLYTIDCLPVEILYKIHCSLSFATVAIKIILELRQKSDIFRPCRSNHASNTSPRVVASCSRVKYS